MLTKYFIEIDGNKHEIPQCCIRNWDEVKCVYKRSDFSGVSRSFTSRFEFVGDMHRTLMSIYFRDGVNAKAVITLCTITDNWEWKEQFSSDLDFSSISWDDYVVKINCIDDSLASAIKARKGTKYEFMIGHDIPVANSLLYDRVTMINSCAHEIMGDKTDDTFGDYVDIYPSNLKRLPTYAVSDGETYENSPVLFSDQSEDNGSCFIEVVKNTNELEIEIEIITDGHTGNGDIVNKANIFLMSFNKSNPVYSPSTYTQVGQIFSYKSIDYSTRECLGLFPTFDALKQRYPEPQQNVWALVGDDLDTASEAYVSPVGNAAAPEWIPAMADIIISHRQVIGRKCSKFVFRNKFTLSNVTKDTCLALFYECDISSSNSGGRPKLLAIKSKLKTRWKSKARTVSIDALLPRDVCRALIGKITDNRLNVEVSIDDADTRLSKTYLFAAESIRNIPGARLYTTFNDFCGFMETVFGYTYYLGKRERAPFRFAQSYLPRTLSGADQLLHTKCPGYFSKDVSHITGTPYFAVVGADYDGYLRFYTKWEGSEKYNDPETGMARLDTLFYDENYRGMYFDSEYETHAFIGDVSKGIIDSQKIHFVPRSRIFAGNNVIRIDNARDIQYSVNSGIAYSSVMVGYEKQEYAAECGRDEWNFSAQYNTGIDKLDKSLSLVSKYRADCYGFEFMAQKRVSETTDNKSDSTIFFAYCREEIIDKDSGDEESEEATQTTKLSIDRSACEISGALSDDVFNGQYSPYRCVLANAAYIAAALCPSTLTFASFDGNADVCIDGISGNTDIDLNNQLFSLGELSFTSSDVDTEPDVDALYEVESNGVVYRGFINEVSYRYARNEAVKYKLIIKDIEL